MAAGGGGPNSLDIQPLGPDGAAGLIRSTPGYDFRFNEGIRAMDSSAAHQGMLMSGRHISELQRQGDNFASNEFGNYYNRLAALAGQGATATGTISGAGGAASNNLANIYQNQGAAQADAYGSRTSTLGNALGTFGGGILGYYG